MTRRSWLFGAAAIAVGATAWSLDRRGHGAKLFLYADDAMTEAVSEAIVAEIALATAPARVRSARWEAYLTIDAAGDYEFIAEGDAKLRLTINGVPVLDRWDEFAGPERSRNRRFARGVQRLIVEAHELERASSLRLDWRGPRHERQHLGPALRWR